MKRASCVVIVRNGRFAAIRSHKHGGRLCLPGGKTQIGLYGIMERPQDTAERECVEEIGVVPIDLTAFYVAVDVDGFLVTLFYATISPLAELESSEEGEAVWCTRQELLENGAYAAHTAEWLPLYDELFAEVER